MTKKEECLRSKPWAYYSGFGGVEINTVELGITDYVYCTSGAWTGEPSYHKCKIYNTEKPYFKLYGVKIPFADIVRM